MKLSKYFYIVLILSSFAFFSCMDDDLIEKGGITSGPVTLSAELSVPSSLEVITRAGENHETIDNVTVLVFDDPAGGTNGSQRLLEIVKVANFNKNSNSFSIELEARAEKTLIYVLANVSGYFNGVTIGTHSTLSTIMELLTASISAGSINNGFVSSSLGYPLPMVGKLSLSNGISGSTKINKTGVVGGGPLPMVRSIAKLSVTVAPTASDFQLQGAALCNVSSAGRIISNQGDVDNVFSLPDDSPEILAVSKINYYNMPDNSFIFKGTGSIDNMYTYETKAKGAESVKLVIYGLYKTQPVYYLLGIMNDTKENYDIIRNHNYHIKIEKVIASGADTFNKALHGPIANNKEVSFNVEDESIYENTVYQDGFTYSLDFSSVTLYADSLENFTLSYLVSDSDGLSGKFNSQKATSNIVNGQPTLYFTTTNNNTATFNLTGVTKGTPRKHAIVVNIMPGFIEGSVDVRLGNYEQTISLKKEPFLDLHVGSMKLENLMNIRVTNTTGVSASDWLTVSSLPFYLPVFQENYLTYSTPSTAYIYIDETSDLEPRYADLEYIELNNNQVFEKKKLVIGQSGIRKYNIGFWGGSMVNNANNIANFSKQLLVERYEEDGDPLLWINAISDITDKSTLLNENTTPAKATYLLASYKSPAALRCLNKNRDLNGNGRIDEDEVKWFLPSDLQMMGLSLYQRQLQGLKATYWTSTASTLSTAANSQAFFWSTNSATDVDYPNAGGYGGPQLSTSYVMYQSAWGANHWEKRYVRCVREL